MGTVTTHRVWGVPIIVTITTSSIETLKYFYFAIAVPLTALLLMLVMPPTLLIAEALAISAGQQLLLLRPKLLQQLNFSATLTVCQHDDVAFIQPCCLQCTIMQCPLVNYYCLLCVVCCLLL